MKNEVFDTLGAELAEELGITSDDEMQETDNLSANTKFIVNGQFIIHRRIPFAEVGIRRVATGELSDDMDVIVKIDSRHIYTEFKQTELDGLVKYLIQKGCWEFRSSLFQRYLLNAIDEATSYALDYPDFVFSGHQVVGSYNNDYYGVNKVDSKTGEIITSKYKGINKLVNKGNLSVYLAAFNRVTQKPITACIAAAACAGILKDRYFETDKEKQVVINIFGQSGIGKTSSLLFANSIFGSEYSSYRGTLNSILERCVSRGAGVSCLDDISEIKDMDITSSKAVRDFIFDISSSVGKDRLKSTGDLREIRNASSTILLSTITQLLPLSGENNGQVARIIEIPIMSRDDIADSAEELENNLSILSDNCGNFGDAFAQAIIKEENRLASQGLSFDIKSIYKEYKNKLVKRLPDARLANRAAMITMTAGLMNKFMDVSLDIDSIEDLLVSRLCYQHNHFAKQTNKLDIFTAEEKLREYFETWKSYFHKSRYKNSDERNQSLGIYEKNLNGDIELYIPDSEENKILPYIMNSIEPEIINKVRAGEDCNEQLEVLYNIDGVLEYWRNIGVLETTRKGYKERLTIQTGKGQEVVYKLILHAQKEVA